MRDFDTFTKFVDNLGIIIAARDFEKFPKVQQIAQSGHTVQMVVSKSVTTQDLKITIIDGSSLANGSIQLIAIGNGVYLPGPL